MFNYAQGSIAGVSLDYLGDHVKALILDGAAVKQQFKGSQKIAAGGQVWTQIIDVGTKGAQFGVALEFIPVTMLDAIVDAINGALANDEPFLVELQDDVHDISVNVMPDFSVGQSKWLSYDRQRTTDFIANVTIRFIAVE